jgi:UDP-N-acetylglucosamine 2-epimerase (non-hydrolysing)
MSLINRRQKVMLVFGTRPEAIKMAPLVHALRLAPDSFEVKVCVTAQHRQMLDQVLALFDIVPDIDLNLMKPEQGLHDITAAVLLSMSEVLRIESPDILLVHGDTTTSLAAAMAAFYQGIKVAHVEAGLRTWDVHAPFPEEFNRQVVSRVAALHFSPTSGSRDNLLAEGIPSSYVHVTGNTVIDALHWVLSRIEFDSQKAGAVVSKLDASLDFDWQRKRFILITGHRRENFGDGFLEICQAIQELAKTYSEVHFVYPVHLNPNVQTPVRQMLGELQNVHLIEPLEYEPFVVLMKHSYLVLTDSGGIQEEAPSLGKPVLVMREVTERPEAVKAGTVRLVGANQERIFNNISELLEEKESYLEMARASNPYGDGKACHRIVDILRNN